MELIELYPIKIYKFKLNFDCDSLAQEILKLKETTISEPQTISNVGGWQSMYYDTGEYTKKTSQEFMDPVIKAVKEKVLPLTESHGVFSDLYIRYWHNVNYKGHYNKLHNHADSFLSCVFYVKVPSANITFYDPFVPKSVVEKTAVVMTPEENDLFIFPAFMPHSVEPNISENPRISIAFNCNGVYIN